MFLFIFFGTFPFEKVFYATKRHLGPPGLDAL